MSKKNRMFSKTEAPSIDPRIVDFNQYRTLESSSGDLRSKHRKKIELKYAVGIGRIERKSHPWKKKFSLICFIYCVIFIVSCHFMPSYLGTTCSTSFQNSHPHSTPPNLVATGILEALNLLGKYAPHLSFPSFFFLSLQLPLFLTSSLFLLPSFRCNKANHSRHARHERYCKERKSSSVHVPYCTVTELTLKKKRVGAFTSVLW